MMKKVILAWASPSEGDQGPSHATFSLSPSISLTIKFSQFYGFCPVRLGDIGINWFVLAWSTCLFILEGALAVDLFHYLMTESALFAVFTHKTVIALLYLSVAVQGAANQAVNLICLQCWKTLVHAVRIIPDHSLTADCKKGVRWRCHGGIGTVLAICMGYIVCMSQQEWPETMTKLGDVAFQAQHFLVFTAIAVPAMGMMVMCKNLVFHFEHVRQDFLLKFHNYNNNKKYTAGQALALTDGYLKLTTALESLDGVFSWFLLFATIGSAVSGTFVVYLVLWMKKVDMEPEPRLLVMLTVQLVSCLVMMHSGYTVNEASRILKKDLMVASPEKYDDRAGPIMNQLQNYLSDPDWGISVGKFFKADRMLILTIAGIIFSHILLLVEIGLLEDTEMNTTKSKTI